MICWSCNGENTSTNNYCAHCGVSLGPELEKLGSQIDERIATALDAKLRDQKWVEYEVTEAVVTRLAGWGRGLAILVGALVTVLGYLGFSEISGTSKFIETEISSMGEVIENAKREIEQEKENIELEAERITTIRAESEDLKNDIQVLKSKIASTDRLVADSRATEALNRSLLGWDPQEGKFTKPENIPKIRTWLDENGLEDVFIPTFLAGAEFSAARQKAAADLTETTRRGELLTNVPERKVAEIVKSSENEGATVTVSKQPDGNWTISTRYAVTTEFDADEDTTAPEKWIEWDLVAKKFANPDNVTTLMGWISDPARGNLPGLAIPTFLYGKEYAEPRRKAVADLVE